MKNSFTTTPQDAQPCCYCPICKCEIYPCDTVYQWDDGVDICESCFVDQVRAMDPVDMARAMNLLYRVACDET